MNILQNHQEQLKCLSKEIESQVECKKHHLQRVIDEIKLKENIIEEKLLKNEQSLYVLAAGLKWMNTSWLLIQKKIPGKIPQVKKLNCIL